MRPAVGALGVLLGLYGGWLLVTREDMLTDVAVWLVAGVVLHDAVLAAVTVALGALAVRLVPPPGRAPARGGGVVRGGAARVARPRRGGWGARADNPTLLDRDYTAGWLLLAGLTVVAVVVASLVRSRRGSGRR